MRVLITGGAGFIGSHSAVTLLEAGHQVRILDNFLTGRSENLFDIEDDVDLVRGDIRDETLLTRTMEGIEAVLHLAAVVSVPVSIERTSFAHAVNATGTLSVMEAARHAGIGRFVYASSAAVYGMLEVPPASEEAALQPASPYGSQKRYNEETGRLAHELHGMETIGLRYFNVFGPRQDPASPYSGVLSIFADRLIQERPVTIYGDGQQTRDFVFVEDVARANFAALTADQGFGEAFNVGTGKATSVLEAFEAIARSLSSETQPTFGPARTGDIRHSVADVRLIQRKLGWQSRVAFAEGIDRTIHHFQETLATL